MIHTIAAEGLCGMEAVEVSPPYDVNDDTAQLATTSSSMSSARS